MFFIFSKILAFVLLPQLHSLFLSDAGPVYVQCLAPGAGQRGVVLAFLLPLVYSWTLVGETLVRPLENHMMCPAPEPD